MKTEHKVLSVLAAATTAAVIGAAAVSAAGLGESGEGIKPFTVNGSEPITITVPLDESAQCGAASVTAEFDAGTLPAGNYKFSAREVLDIDAERAFYDAIDNGITAYPMVVVDISLYTADGQEIHDVTPTITLETEVPCAFNAIGIYKDGKIEWVAYYYDNGYEFPDVNENVKLYTATFKAPHLSRFVFASLYRQPDEPIAPPDDDHSVPDTEPVEQTSVTSNTDTSKTNTDKDISKTETSVKPDTSEGYKTGDYSNVMALVFAIMSIAALGTALFATKAKRSSK